MLVVWILNPPVSCISHIKLLCARLKTSCCLETGWQRGFSWCVMGPKLSAWGGIGHSTVMRDLLFSQHVMRDFPLKFPWWLILFLTRHRDIKNRELLHQLLDLFPRSSNSDFLRSNDNMILVNVVNILYYFSVMRDSLKNRCDAW